MAKAAAKKQVKVGKAGSYRNGKAHFIDIIIAQTGSSKKTASATVDALLDAVVATVKKPDQQFKLPGFGAFRVRKRAARKGRNPFTGEMTTFKASKRVVFRAAKPFKDSV